MQEGEPGWRKGAGLTEEEEERRRRRGGLRQKMNYNEKGPGPACGLSVCLSADAGKKGSV